MTKLVFEDDDRIEKWEGGVRHCEDGPAVIFKKTNRCVWFVNGKIHREDGPAITDPVYGDEFYINYRNITNQVVIWAKQNDVDLKCMTVAQELSLSFFLMSFKYE